MNDGAPAGRAILKYKIHWHVVFTHFPISFFVLSLLLMALHLVTGSQCYEQTAFLSLLAGAVAMLPTTLSGWLTWKGRYKGMRGKIFIYKIRISIAMIAGSFLLSAVRAFFPEGLHEVWLLVYASGILMLMLGASAEGYYGGRLNHR